MVGGIVIGLTRRVGEPTHANVADCPHYPKHERWVECPRPDTCCVYIDEADLLLIRLGDFLWWQGSKCYWTPKDNRGKSDSRCGVDYDIPLPKIGYSH